MNTLFDHEGRLAPTTKVALRVLAALFVLLSMFAATASVYMEGLAYFAPPQGWISRQGWLVNTAFSVLLTIEFASYAVRGRGVLPASSRYIVYGVLTIVWLSLAGVHALTR